MQINNNNNKIPSFGKLYISNDVYRVIKSPSQRFKDLVGIFTRHQAKNQHADVFVDNYKNMRIKFKTGDSISKIWSFEKGPSNFLCLDEKNVYNYDLRNIIFNMKKEIFIPGEFEKVITTSIDKATCNEIVKEEVMCTTPNFHRVGEYLPQKYYSIPRMIGCTPIEATFLLRLRKFTGFANYFNDILELFHYSSPKEAMEYLKSLQPKNVKEFIK